MPLSTKSTKGEQMPETKAKKSEPAKSKAAKPDPTPSAHAVAEVGEAPEGASPEAVLEHGRRYKAEKLKRRWGIG